MLSFISVFYKHLANQAPKAVSYLIGSSILLILLLFLKQYTGLWLFEASIDELKGWYPRFYFFIFYGLKILLYIPYGILLFQSFWVYHLSKIKWWEFSLLITLSSITLFIVSLPYWHVIFSITLLLIHLIYIQKDALPSPIIKTLEKKDKWWVFGLLLLAFIIRFVLLLYTDNSENGDAGMRLLGAKRWIDVLSTINIDSYIFRVFYFYFLMPSSDWLPLHYYLIGITHFFTDDWIYAPRILTIIFASLSIIPLYRLTLLKFNRTTAIIASFILIFYGYHIIVSVQTLSEAFYSFFILWTLYSIEKWNLQQKDKTLIFLGFLLLALCWLRYEGWFISFFIVLLLPIIRKIKNWKNYFVFSGIVLLGVSYIMLLEIAYGYHPLKGILYSDYEVKIAIAQEGFSYKNILNEYSFSYLPFAFLFILIYLFQLTREKKSQSSLLIFLIYLLPLFPFIFKLMNGTLTAQARYLTIYMTPLIPFIAYSLSDLLKRNRIILIVGVTGYIVLSNFLLLNTIKNNKILLKYEEGFHESAAFIKKQQGARMYLDTEKNWGEFNWGVTADAHVQFVFSTRQFINKKRYKSNFLSENSSLNSLENNSKKNIVVSSVTSDMDDCGVWNIKAFNYLVDQDYITHIIIFPDGLLYNALDLDNGKTIYRDKKLKEIFNNNGYLIYQIE